MTPIVTKDIEDYCEKHSTPESAVASSIASYTQNHTERPQMLIGPLEAAFLGFLTSITKAKRILEIGCFTGYSALAMAERLPDDGEVITLDIDTKIVETAQSFWQKSTHGQKIKPFVGPALDSLRHLSGPFDLVFIDADKTNYQNYFNSALSMLSANGIIVADNCLWNGDVLKLGGDEDTRALRAFNAHIAARTDLEKVLLPLRDGVFLIRKKTF